MQQVYHDSQNQPTKICTKCHTEKPLDQFYKEARGVYGRRSDCKTCRDKQTNEYAANHPGMNTTSQRKHVLTHGTNREAINKWEKAHPNSRRERESLRRARRKSATVEKINFDRIIERDGYYCYICDKPIDPLVKQGDAASLTFDHVKPLAGNGDCKGDHSEDNIRPAHRVCNTRKGIKLLSEMTDYQRRGPTE